MSVPPPRYVNPAPISKDVQVSLWEDVESFQNMSRRGISESYDRLFVIV